MLWLRLLPSAFLTEKFSSSSYEEQASEKHETKGGIVSGTSSLHLWENNNQPLE